MPKPDPREHFLTENTSRHVNIQLTPAAIEDLRYFGERAKAGKALTWDALRRWMLEKHNITAGRGKLHGLTQEQGITPWWCK